MRLTITRSLAIILLSPLALGTLGNVSGHAALAQGPQVEAERPALDAPASLPPQAEALLARKLTNMRLGLARARLNQAGAEVEADGVVKPADIYDDVMLRDLLPGDDKVISTHPSLRWSPTVDGDRIVWVDGRNGVGNRDIFAYNYALGFETQLTADTADQYAPEISGSRVVYIDMRSGNEDIYMYDIATGVETPICTDSAIQLSPSIHGDDVAWLDYRDGTFPAVYRYDLSTGTESAVSVPPAYTSPSLSGGRFVSVYDGRIAWCDHRNGHSDIYLYDIATDTETRITDNVGGQCFPNMDDRYIVWQDNRNSPVPFDPDTEQLDIYYYDLTTGTEAALSTDPGRDRLPTVDGGRVVWTRGEDVLMHDLASGSQETIAAGAGILAEPRIHGHRIVWKGPAPAEPSVRLLFVPLRWTRSQADFDAEAETQVSFFRDAVPLSACPERLAVTTLNVDTQSFDTFTCTSGAGGDCGVGSLEPFVDSLGINHADYTAVVGLIDGTPCFPIRGCSSGGGHFVWADTVRIAVTAHELGHQFGLEDEYCSNPAGSDDCRCNDGDSGDCCIDARTGGSVCEDTGGDGAATGDLNWLDSSLGCDPDGLPCCSGCAAVDYGVCCEGNQNDAGGRCIMTYANAPGPRGFCDHCRDHLATFEVLGCGADAMATQQVAPPSPQILELSILIHADDTVEEQRIMLRRGRESMDNTEGGQYRIAVADEGGKELWSQDFDLYFDHYGAVDKGVDYTAVSYAYQHVTKRIPYHDTIRRWYVFKDETEIHTGELNFCNQDGTCGPAENHLTCPVDCPLDESDGVCLPLHDGTCDPDCDYGVDPDCETAESLLYVKPGRVMLGVSETFSVAVRIDDVADLYGVQLEMAFDPAIVEVVDADPYSPGVQVAAGSFLNPDDELRNIASNERGTIEYTASLRGEKPGKDGSGTLLWIGLHGLTPGATKLGFTSAVLSDPESVAIEADRRPGTIIVEESSQVGFSATGRLILERRGSNAGASVCASSNCVTTSDSGEFRLDDLRVGQEISGTHPSYLLAARTLLDAPGSPDRVLTLPDVTLLGGDVDQSFRIFLNDGALIGMAMVDEPIDEPWYHVRDITADGVVDIRDMVAVQYNWDTSAPGPWPDVVSGELVADGEAADARTDSPSVFRRFGSALGRLLGTGTRQDGAVVKIDPAEASADGLGVPVRVDVAVENVTGLYAFAVKVRFDPAVVHVRDANPTQEGVQVIPGEFLDYEHWVVLQNQADNETGIIDLAITQSGRTPGRDGSGVLGGISFVGVSEGTSEIRIVEAELLASDYPNTTPIQSTSEGGMITIGGGGYAIFAPITVKGVELR